MTEPVATPVAGKPNLLLGAYEVADLGYAAEEFFVSGTASCYAAESDLGSDGRWSVTPSGTADYTTRMVVLRPVDDTGFNGTVLVEWLNVSGGIDAPALWLMAHREVVREGYAYVVDLGATGGCRGRRERPRRHAGHLGYVAEDPGSRALCDVCSHPGDAFAYDIFTQIGRLVSRPQRPSGSDAPELVLAVGESQSATFMTTYVNAVDPLAKVYDGFLVHSRFGGRSTAGRLHAAGRIVGHRHAASRQVPA